jgi:hypothetical protein
MLSVSLDPVQSQCMQEGRETFHDTQDREGENEPQRKHDNRKGDAGDPGHTKRALQCHVVQDLGELGVREGKGPQTEIRRAMQTRQHSQSQSRFRVTGMDSAYVLEMQPCKRETGPLATDRQESFTVALTRQNSIV